MSGDSCRSTNPVVNVLEINLPEKLSKEGFTEEQRKLLNQILISKTITTDNFYQIIHVYSDESQSTKENHTCSLLRYLAEVHSHCWNEAIAKKMPNICLYVCSDSLPGSSKLESVVQSVIHKLNGPVQLSVSSSSVERSNEVLTHLQTSLSSSSNRNSVLSPTSAKDTQDSSSGCEIRYSVDERAVSEYNRVVHGFQTDIVRFIDAEVLDQSTFERYPEVAVGGTFDHLHPGHTLLLTIAASLCTGTLTIGITSDELLRGRKAHEYLIGDYPSRVSQVENFFACMFPSLQLDIHCLLDGCGPAVVKEQLEAIVVSSETLSGALFINDIRRQKGMQPLNIYVVSRRDAVILSSSFIRTQLHEQQQHGR